ncbi:hypothetical protein [Alicyclobacillus acidoterrestris]
MDVMASDAARMRGERPFLFTNLLLGEGLDEVVQWIEYNAMLVGP